MPCLARLVLALAALKSALGHLRDYTCLPGARSPSDRRNVTINGTSQPIKISCGSWDSSLLEAWIYRIVAEDVLGVNIEGPQAVTTSTKMWDMVTEGETHVAMGIWEYPSFKARMAETQRKHPEKMPWKLGSLGYHGVEGFFLKEESLAPAMQDHMGLDFYIAYSDPQLDRSRYFDDYQNISYDWLAPCNETTSTNVEDYVRATGDYAGVRNVTVANTTTYEAICADGYWWISPACRANTSRCIPSVTDALGYADVQQLMHRSFFWNMPLAVAVAQTWANYSTLPKVRRTIFYWWEPDGIFSLHNATRIYFPRFNQELWDQGIYKTDNNEPDITKAACKALMGRGSEGTEQAVQALRNMQLSASHVKDLIKAYKAYGSTGPAAYEAVACEWLKSDAYPWEDWLSLSTACTDQQGLISQNGTFVMVRDEKAESCTWCSPGRMSVRFSDAQGTTYRCEACPPGSFQKFLGSTACDPCGIGEANALPGSNVCQRCPLGRYSDIPGQEACEACPQGFITSLIGSKGLDSCVCPEGTYRSATDRSLCTECKRGMTCPEASDELNYALSTGNSSGDRTSPLLQSGFWSSIEDPLSIFACEGGRRCPGGSPSSPCAENLELQGCAHCIDEYYWNGQECLPCMEDAARQVIIPIAAAIVIPVTICVLYYFSGDPYALWSMWYHGISASIYIVLDHYQAVNNLRQTNLQHPEYVSSTFKSVGVMTDVLSLMTPDCNGAKSFSVQLVIQCTGPAMVFCMYLIIWGASKIVGLRFPKASMDINCTLEGFFSIMLIFFGAISVAAFTIFKCGINPNGSYSLLIDRSVQCYEGEWNAMAAIGVVAVLCWCVGFGLLFARAIWRAPVHLHQVKMQKRWRFLFIRYRPDVHWWALTFVAKGVMLNLGSTLITSGIGQVYWFVTVLLGYTLLSFTFRPWRHVLNANFDIWVNLCLCFTCVVVVWSAREPSLHSDWGDAIGQTVLVMSVYVCVCVPVLPLIAVVVYRGGAAAHAKKEADIDRIYSTFIRINNLDFEEAVFFLRLLHEPDFQLMKQAMYLIQTEVARNKCRPGYSGNRLSARAITIVTRRAEDVPGLDSIEDKSVVPSNSEDVENKSSTRCSTSSGVRVYL